MNYGKIGLAGLLLSALGIPALADPVPNGTLAISGPIGSTVTPTTIDFDGVFVLDGGGTGGFAGLASAGTTSTTAFSYSQTIGVTVFDTVSALITFGDGSGDNYVFDLASVLTESYSSNPGVSTGVTLYLLGALSDANLGYTATAASVTLQLNQTGTSSFSAASTLAIPPSPITPPAVPEPASLLLLGGGVLALFGITGMVRRRAV